MTDKQSGTGNPSPSQEPATLEPPTSTWPETYSTPRLKKFGTLTQLTLSGTQSGNFEINLLTKKYKPKPKS
jgi:hypothetical protein